MSWVHAADLVPTCAGFTASVRPSITRAWNPSFTYGEAFGASQRRLALVSFSVKSHSASVSVCRLKLPSTG